MRVSRANSSHYRQSDIEIDINIDCQWPYCKVDNRSGRWPSVCNFRGNNIDICFIKLFNTKRNKEYVFGHVLVISAMMNGKSPHISSSSSGRQCPQIRRQYGIKSKAAINLTFDSHCKTIAALFFIMYCRLFLRTLPDDKDEGILWTVDMHDMCVRQTIRLDFRYVFQTKALT